MNNSSLFDNNTFYQAFERDLRRARQSVIIESPFIAKRHAYEHFGGCIIVSRELWDTVRGFDPGFVGWGHEDGAFLAACTILSGKQCRRVAGKVFHLDHNPSPIKNPRHPQYIANRKRMIRYTQATHQPNAQELLGKLRDETIGIV